MALSFGISYRAAGLVAERALSGRGPSLWRHALLAHRAARFYATTIEADSHGFMLQSDESGKHIETRLSKIWLRYVLRCKQCVNQDTMQRNFNTFEIPDDIAAKEVVPDSEGVEVLWSDSHKSSYTWAWLQSTLPSGENKTLSNDVGKRLWNGSIAASAPEVAFEDVMNTNDKTGMADLTDKIRAYGLCFVANTPKTPEATNELLESIGPVRHTHYGGFYDFVPDLAKADTAYTNLALAAHTDTTYFTEPAGLQAFHMLSHTPPPNRPSAKGTLGGKSLLVDGFYAAHRLRRESPDDFNVLCKTRIPWHASGNEGIAIAPDRAYPVLEARGRMLRRVRWNNDDRGVVPLDVDVDKWYRAARKWDEILKRKQNEYWFQLEPGRVLIFDNWRVLHGRSVFEGLRRICGGYINRDDFISRWKTTNFPTEDVIAANMQLR
ncbi:Trimethyllysine dioxygenase [Tolypocladium capitatum]|uniref:trimethyllysine dioxygenase n=1 Tax=Tolypocladium capitatum TaxID=45235 RepID=A0A2K3QG09_9HYPO|nr:Trimethyllysine dioxygenase [Tolypocladium capitatum]